MAQRLQQAGVNGLLDHEERQPQRVVDPVVGDSPQTQTLARHIASGRRGLRTVVDTYVAVHVKGTDRLRRRLHPASAQLCGPASGGVVGSQFGEFAPQAAHLRYPVQPQQSAELPRRLAPQLLDGLDAAQRHEPHQDQHVHRRVVTSQTVQQPVGTAEQPVGHERRQGTEHAAVRDIQTGLEARRRPVQYAHGGQDPLADTRAGRAQAGGRGGVPHAARRLVGERSRSGFTQSSVRDRLTQRVGFHAELFGHLGAPVLLEQQPLRLFKHHGGQHRPAATAPAALEERPDSALAVATHGTGHARLRHPEGTDHLCLGTRLRVDQLRGQHLEHPPVVCRVPSDRVHAHEVRPAVQTPMDAHPVADRSGTRGNKG